MLGDHTLAPTHGFLRELQTNLSTWADEFSEAVRRVGETTFRPALKSADNLWRECAQRYGYGGGYRDTVAQRIATWFTDAP
jgi:hypothetical protein